LHANGVVINFVRGIKYFRGILIFQEKVDQGVHFLGGPNISLQVCLAETKSEHQWLSEPTKSKTASKYILTFRFAYENGHRHGEGDRREGYVFFPIK